MLTIRDLMLFLAVMSAYRFPGTATEFQAAVKAYRAPVDREALEFDLEQAQRDEERRANSLLDSRLRDRRVTELDFAI